MNWQRWVFSSSSASFFARSTDFDLLLQTDTNGRVAGVRVPRDGTSTKWEKAPR